MGKYRDDLERGVDWKSPEYGVWNSMKRRCRDESVDRYIHYGGRGISFDPRWEYFSNFINDMGNRPSKAHQIDRIDNNGNYCKENCRWVERSTNQANKRRPSKSLGAHKGRWGGWKSSIGIQGHVYHIGTFKTKEEAQEEYCKVFKEWYGFLPNTEVMK